MLILYRPSHNVGGRTVRDRRRLSSRTCPVTFRALYMPQKQANSGLLLRLRPRHFLRSVYATVNLITAHVRCEPDHERGGNVSVNYCGLEILWSRYPHKALLQHITRGVAGGGGSYTDERHEEALALTYCSRLHNSLCTRAECLN